MRILVFTIAAGLAGLAPRAARACSYSSCLYDSPRIEALTLHTTSPVPRDGAFVFGTGQEQSPLCLDELAPHLSITVTREGIAVPGEVVQFGGVPTLLIWRPAELLVAGATYEVEVVVDNDGIGPAMGDWGDMCGPSPLLAAFELTAGDTFATTPPLPAPVLTAMDRTWDTSLLGVACCPGVTPEYFDGGCHVQVLWDFDNPNGCGFVHGFTGLEILGEPPPLPTAVARQFLMQLVVDDVPVRRGLSEGSIAAFRRSVGCARLERIHLGTGEVIASAETCLTPELAAQLGPKTLDPMLSCEDGQMCAGDDHSWEGACMPFDADAAPPPPAEWPYDTELDPRCQDASVPSVPDPPDESTSGPTTSAGDDSGPDASSVGDDSSPDASSVGDDSGPDASSEGDGGAPADADASRAGCACDLGSRPDAVLPLIVGLLGWRRRPVGVRQPRARR